MRLRLWFLVGLVGLLGAVSVALAAHVPQVDPDTVPPGFLATHNIVENKGKEQLEQIAERNRLQVFVQHIQVGPNEALPWHSHPGPVVVTVVEGALTYEDAAHGECRRVTYQAGTGFTDHGFGKVHRAIAGPEGADFYATYLLPRRAETQTTPADPKKACVT